MTDLAQSESSLAGAIANLIAAKNNLLTSEAKYEKIIGKKPPKNLQEIKKLNLKRQDNSGSVEIKDLDSNN